MLFLSIYNGKKNHMGSRSTEFGPKCMEFIEAKKHRESDKCIERNANKYQSYIIPLLPAFSYPDERTWRWLAPPMWRDRLRRLQRCLFPCEGEASGPASPSFIRNSVIES
jgi:hypothetical protein